MELTIRVQANFDLKPGEAERIGEELDAGLLEIGRAIADRARVRVGVVTGALKSSILAKPVGRHRVAVGSNLRYARQREYGGEIRPRYKKALRFRIHVATRIATMRGGTYRRLKRPRKIWSDWIFAKRVVQKGSFFLRDATAEVTGGPMMEEFLQRIGGRVARRVGFNV